MQKSKNSRLIISAIAALLTEMLYPALVGNAHAAITPFDVAFVRWDTHEAATDSGLTACMKISGGSDITIPGSSGTTPYHIVLTLPHMASGTDFSFNSTLTTNWAVDTTFTGEGSVTVNATTYAMTAFPNIAANADTVTAPTAGPPRTPGIVKIPFGNSTAFNLDHTKLYCFHITGTNTLHNSDAGSAPTMVEGSLEMYNNAGTPLQLYETFYNTSIITDDTVNVSAIVPPNFTMTLSPTSLDFGRLSTQTINTTAAAAVLDVVTNAAGGWISWIRDTNRGAGLSGLRSTTAAYTIRSGGEGGPGTGLLDSTPELLKSGGGQEGYLMDADFTDAANGCTGFNNSGSHGSADGGAPDYDADESTINAGVDTYSGGTLSEIFQPLANCTGAPPATANHDQVTMHAVATISGATPAGTDYSDTWTIVAAGQF